MLRIENKFKELKQAGRKALIGFISAGDPDYETSLVLIKAMLDNGIDILELGIPFSDPTADGAVIQAASQRSLKSGFTLRKVFDMVTEIRKYSEIPIIIFSYYNPVFYLGGRKFYDLALESGADGALIVDLPIDEADELTEQFPNSKLDIIRLVAPTSPKERMRYIAENSAGFIYLISQTGVTGKNNADPVEVAALVKELKAATDVPVCVGFGISTANDARTMSRISDGVIIGSAFERVIANNLNEKPEVIAIKLGALVREFKAALE